MVALCNRADHYIFVFFVFDEYIRYSAVSVTYVQFEMLIAAAVHNGNVHHRAKFRGDRSNR